MSGPSGNQLVLFSLESWCFPRLRLGKHQDFQKNKANCFPWDLTLSIFCINFGLTGPVGVQVTIICYHIYETRKLLVTHVVITLVTLDQMAYISHYPLQYLSNLNYWSNMIISYNVCNNQQFLVSKVSGKKLNQPSNENTSLKTHNFYYWKASHADALRVLSRIGRGLCDEKRESLRGRLTITKMGKLITVPIRSFNLKVSAGVKPGRQYGEHMCMDIQSRISCALLDPLLSCSPEMSWRTGQVSTLLHTFLTSSASRSLSSSWRWVTKPPHLQITERSTVKTFPITHVRGISPIGQL